MSSIYQIPVNQETESQRQQEDSHAPFDRSTWLPRPSAYRCAYNMVKAIEPWGVLLGVVALLLSLFSFWFNYEERIEERTRGAWELLALSGTGNSGKRAALEYLNQEKRFLWWIPKKREPLTGIDLSQEYGKPGTYLRNVDLQSADLTRADLSAALLSEASLRGANLTSVDLTGAKLHDTDLRDANLVKSRLGGAEFIGADLTRADLSEARLFGVYLTRTNLTDAKLSSANLSGAKMADTELRGAVLKGATLTGAEDLTQSQLDNACGDEQTVLAEGLSIPICE